MMTSSSRILIMILFYQVLMRQGAAHVDDCRWVVEGVRWDRPFEMAPLVENIVVQVNITDAIQEIEMGHLNSNPSLHGFHSFPYYLRTVVQCESQQVSDTIGRNFVLAGTTPTLRVTLEGDDSHACSVITEVQMATILLDISEEHGGECNSSLCTPTWIAPLPVADKVKSFHVDVTTEQLGCAWIKSGQTIHVDGFLKESELAPTTVDNMLGTPTDMNEMKASLATDKAFPMKIIIGLSPMAVIGGFGNDLLLYSSNDFMNMTLLTVNITDGMDSVCQPDDDSTDGEIFEAVALADRVLLGTPAGLIQMMANFKSVYDMDPGLPWTPQIISPTCVKEIVIPKQHYPKVFYAFLITKDDRLLLTNETDDEVVNLGFNEVPVCDATGDSFCTIVSMDVLPTGEMAYLVLLDSGNTSDTSRYKVLRFQVDNSTLVQSIPKDVMVNPEHSDHVLWQHTQKYSSHESAEEGMRRTVLNLRGISTTSHISLEVYLWGSHLIQSLDAGKTFHFIDEFQGRSNIISFTTSINGYYAFLTDTQEIWVGITSNRHVSRIYPSIGWSAYAMMDDIIKENYTTVSLFFDAQSQLKQLISYEDENGNLTVSLRMIPLVEILKSVIFQHAIHDKPRKVTSWSEVGGSEEDQIDDPVHECPFYKMLFIMPTNILGFIGKQVLKFGPPRQFYRYGENENALKGMTVHQAIVHLLLHKELSKERMYQDDFNSRTERWKDEGLDEVFTGYMFRNGQSKDGLHLHLEDYSKDYSPDGDDLTSIPDKFYLDRFDEIVFTLHLQLSSDHHLASEIDTTHDTSEPHIFVEVANTSLLAVTVERHENQLTESINYEIMVKASKSVDQQSYPGVELQPTCFKLNVGDSLLKCTEEVNHGIKFLGMNTINVLLGCPPNFDLMFDIKMSLEATKVYNEYPYDCVQVDPDLPCFYFGNGFYPYFNVIDRASGRSRRFQGNYTLKIVGGKSVDATEYEAYPQDKIDMYNQQNQSFAQGLVWNPVNVTHVNDNGWFVYSHENNAINWMCLPNSPCSYISPLQLGDSPEFYFELEFSNEGVDSSTFCVFTKRFKVHLHGIQMNMTTTPLVIVGITLAAFILYIVLYFLCHSKNHAVYNAIKRAIMRIISLIIKKKQRDVPEYLSRMSILVDEAECQSYHYLHDKVDDWRATTARMGPFQPIGSASVIGEESPAELRVPSHIKYSHHRKSQTQTLTTEL